MLENVGLQEIQPRRRDTPRCQTRVLVVRIRSDEMTDEIGEVLRRRLLTEHVELAADFGAQRGVALDHEAQGAIMSERPGELRLG